MKICYVTSNFFGWGLYGGFGKLTRTLAVEMSKRGHDVSVLMLRGEGQKPFEIVDPGIKVCSVVQTIPEKMSGFHFRKLARMVNADVYHCQSMSVYGFHAFSATPHAKHIYTAQDPMTEQELVEVYWRLCGYRDYDPKWRFFTYQVYRRMVKLGCKIALVCSQAKYIRPKVRSMFAVSYLPMFLPNPVAVPHGPIYKADEPEVLFLGRWDVIKRVDRFFAIARQLPDVTFICVGKSHTPALDARLRDTASKIPNLVPLGHVKPDRWLERAWILVNTSVRECLPVSFLEASSYGCAIVSPNNPDDFASNFGVHIQDGSDISLYVDAIQCLIDDDSWKKRGNEGRSYVAKTHELHKVITQHERLYEMVQ